MKRLLLIALLALTVSTVTLADGVRTDVLLDTGWVCRPISDPTPTVKDLPVTLPHTWNARYVKGTEYNRETMVYTRRLTVSEEQLRQQRLFLRFEGVNSVADVFVNRHTAGQHKGGYTAFCLEITHLLVPGDNTLEVWASNAFRTDVLPISGDFNIYGGIHRPVHLIVTGKDCISPLYYGSNGVLIRQDKVTKEQAHLTVETYLLASTDKRLRVTMTDAAGKAVAQAETAVTGEVVRQPLTLAKPVLWNGRKNPYLYRVKVELLDGSEVVDAVEEQTGLRYFGVDAEKGFFLNGEPYPLRGFNRHEDVDGKGSALIPEDHERDMQMIKETGATMIRLSHYPQSRYFYELADREGMVLWSEIPLCGPGGYNFTGYVKNAEDNARQVALEMVCQNMNRPSVCFWGIFNEILVNDGRFKAWDDPVPFVRELHQLYKQADPSRLTTFATCVPHTHYLGCSDLMAWNKYFRRPGNEANVRKFYEEAYKTRGGQPLGISEYGDAGSIKIHTDPRYDRQRDHAENYQLLTHEGYWRAIKDMDWLWCKTIWQFSDMQSSIRHEGDRDGMNDKGMVTYDRQTRKDIYYFYKAQWNPEPMVYITGRRFTNRKHAPTDVRVYTNQKDATLYVNGKKIARQQADDIHRIIFKDVQLAEGDNKILVKAGKLSDECTWTLSKPAPVLIVAGQSNADGRVPVSELPADVSYQYCQWSYGSGDFKTATGQFEPFSPTVARTALGDRWGFDAIVYHLLEQSLRQPFYVIKQTMGGTAIDPRCERSTHGNYWSADSVFLSQTKSAGRGGKSLLKALTEQIDACIDQQLSRLPQGYDIRVLLWHQGESDKPQADSYHDNLQQVVAYIRQHLVGKTGNQRYATLPIVCGNFAKNSRQGSAKVAAALTQLAQEDQNFHVVDASDLTLQSDQIHFDAKGAEMLGRRFYEKLVEIKVFD